MAPPAALAPILVVYALVALLGHGPVSTDEASFLGYAKNLTHGFYAQTHSHDPTRYLWHGPGLPALLAPLVAIHAPIGLERAIFGAGMLFAALVVLHHMLRGALSRRAALAVTYAVALYLPFFRIDGLYVEPLATLCLTLVAFFLLRSLRGGRYDPAWAGAALAVLALSRIEFGYVLLAFVVACLAWLIVSRGARAARRAALGGAVALAVCAPWLMYTYSLTHRPLYWGNSGGLSLYWMTAPGSLGDWRRASDAFTNPQLAANRPVLSQVSRLPPLQQDPRLQHLAWENIKHHPGHYLANLVNNLDRLVFNSPYSFTRQKASSLLYALPNGLLLGLLAVALFVAVRLGGRLGAEVLAVGGLALVGFAIHVPVAAYARFVIPLIPITVWLVAAVLGRHLRLVGPRTGG